MGKFIFEQKDLLQKLEENAQLLVGNLDPLFPAERQDIFKAQLDNNLEKLTHSYVTILIQTKPGISRADYNNSLKDTVLEHYYIARCIEREGYYISNNKEYMKNPLLNKNDLFTKYQMLGDPVQKAENICAEFFDNNKSLFVKGMPHQNEEKIIRSIDEMKDSLPLLQNRFYRYFGNSDHTKALKELNIITREISNSVSEITEIKDMYDNFEGPRTQLRGLAKVRNEYFTHLVDKAKSFITDINKFASGQEIIKSFDGKANCNEERVDFQLDKLTKAFSAIGLIKDRLSDVHYSRS